MQRLDLQPYNAKTDEVFQKMGKLINLFCH